MSADTRFTARVAVHLFLIRDGSVLMLRRANTGYEDGNYSVPAGHLDGGEEVVIATIREAREEIGIVLARSAVTVVGVMHQRSDVESIDFFLVASMWTGEIINAEPHKCEELAWYPLDALPTNTIPYVRRALDNYRSGIWFDSYGWDQHGIYGASQKLDNPIR